MSVSTNPFRALLSFERKDRDLLFGRDGDLTLMVDRLMSRRATLLFAGSGVGKTSFLEAKLVTELEDRYFICSHREWAVLKPLAAVEASLAQALRESGWGSKDAATQEPSEAQHFSLLKFFSRPDLFKRPQPCGSILILDQFEEVFQYHKDTDYFVLFIDQLAELINAPAPEVRVLFSMREEFLGELSVFDNKIPDLFNNYYRLKNPSKRQARDIISATVRSVEVQPSESLSLLVGDLLSVSPRDNHASPKATGDTSAAHILRDYVPPPYLQIACYRLWRKTTATKNGEKLTFPQSYETGEARRELELYCRENLESLTQDQQNLICDALGFLMTNQGAKMAYELSNLAQHMDVSQEALRAALEHLSQKNVRILRRFNAPDGSIWFELYHDMYAPFLSAWKVESQKAREVIWQAEEQERERQSAEERALRADAERRAEEEKRQRDEAERTALLRATELAEEQKQRAEEQRQRAEEQKDRADEKARKAKLFKILAWVLAGTSLAAVAGLGFAYHYWKLAKSRELAADAMMTLGVDPELGVLLSLDALGAARTTEVEDSLHHTVGSVQARLTLDPRVYKTDGTLSCGASVGVNCPIRAVAYSPDGSLVATAGDDNQAQVWDAASGQLLRRMSGHSDRLWAIAFSPDGKRLATASLDGSAKVWDVNTGTALYTLSGHSNMVLGIAFSPDGKRLATGSADGTAKLWDADSGTELLTLQGHSAMVYAVAFSPDGKLLATGSEDRTAKLWDTTYGKELQTFPGSGAKSAHAGTVSAVAFSPDGRRLVTASADGTAMVWDASVNPPAQKGTPLAALRNSPLKTLSTSATAAKEAPAVTSVAFDPLGARIATTSSDGAVRIWNAYSGNVLVTLTGHPGAANAVAFEPHGEAVATAGSDSLARVWNIYSGGEVLNAAHSTDALQAIVFSPDGKRIATAGYDDTAQIWDDSGNELHRLVKHSKPLTDVAFSPDGEHVATASLDGTVNLWNVASGKMLRTFTNETSKRKAGSFCVAFSPDGKTLAVGDDDGTVELWDEPSGKERAALRGHRGRISHIAFSPDGKRFATASQDSTAKVWDVDSGKELLTLKKHRDAVTGVVFSPDGRRLATASRDGTAKLSDINSGQELLTFAGHTDSLTAVAFTRDGKRLVTSSWDNTVRLWDASSGIEQLTLSSPVPVFGVAVSPDGKRLATANWDGVLRVYATNFEDLTAQAARAIGRPLTNQECKKYLHATKKCSETSAPALQMVEQGATLARAGELDAATEKFREAQKENRAFNFDPVREAKQLRAGTLVAKGRNLAANGDDAGALQSFSDALALDPGLGFDPNEEARSLVAQGRVTAGEMLVRRGQVTEAIQAYDQAQKTDPSLVIEASSWNELCWYGTLWGHARDVMPDCQQAVSDKNIAGIWNYEDSLGVALALTGKGDEALGKFLTFAFKTSNQSNGQRRLDWIRSLGKGKNPLTRPEEIEWLWVN
jgi:WD40 repeat protein/tetratricopeptide (TPR) repeat protein